MDNIVDDKEIIYTKENAKEEFENGNFPVAKIIFLKLWENSKGKNNFYLSRYGAALRKNGESVEFVRLCDELRKNGDIQFNDWVYSVLCWCIYDTEIKDYTAEDKDNFNAFLERAVYIKDNCRQLNADEHYKNPYVLTIKKVVKTYKDRTTKNYKEILRWLSFLDPDILSEEVYNFQDESGKDRELASPKEFYYQHMAKALEKTEKYMDCIEVCKIAIDQITKFHYRNDTWIKTRLYFSKCMVDPDIEVAIKEYKELAYKEKYWFMYHKLSQICFRYNKMQEALLYASKAYEGRFEHEKMVNLFLDTALLWQSQESNDNSRPFLQASAYYRKRQAWNIPEELEYNIAVLSIDVDKKPNITLIQEIAKKYVASIEGGLKKHDASIEGELKKYEGKVKRILSHGGAGFIKPNDNSDDIYFNMNDVYGKTLLEGDNIEYKLGKGKDDKLKAINIIKRR